MLAYVAIGARFFEKKYMYIDTAELHKVLKVRKVVGISFNYSNFLLYKTS